jgi:excisionase family DNA binding protein
MTFPESCTILPSVTTRVRASMTEAKVSKAAFSVEDFCRSYSVGKTTAYEEISAGRLHAVKVGRRTLIPETSAAEWLKSQPSVLGESERAA